MTVHVVFSKFRHCERVTYYPWLTLKGEERWIECSSCGWWGQPWSSQLQGPTVWLLNHGYQSQPVLSIGTCTLEQLGFCTLWLDTSGQTLSSLGNYRHSSNFMSHLWIGWLGDNISNSIGVSWQSVDTGFGTHVPYLHNECIITISLSLSSSPSPSHPSWGIPRSSN